jgi:hypothetical protein
VNRPLLELERAARDPDERDEGVRLPALERDALLRLRGARCVRAPAELELPLRDRGERAAERVDLGGDRRFVC